MTDTASKLPEDDRADINPDIPSLRDREGLNSSSTEGNEGGSANSTNGISDSNSSTNTERRSGGSSSDTGGLYSSSDLKDAESNLDDGLYNPNADKPGRIKNALTAPRRGLSKLMGKKWLAGFAIGGSLGIIALLVMLFVLLGSLKIPHLVENITAYQFARVTRQMATNSENITAEKMAIDAADDTTWSKIKTKYSTTTGKAKDVHEKLTNKYQPSKIVANYHEEAHFKPIYEKAGIFRGQKLVGVQLDNQSYTIRAPTGVSRFIPGMKFAYNVKNSRVIAPYLKESLKLDGIGPLVRSEAAASMRRELGISLIAWKVGQYQGLSPKEAELKQARDFHSATTKEGPAGVKTGEINKTIDEANQTLEDDIKDNKKLSNILENRGVDPDVVTKVENALTSSGGFLKSLAGFLSPTYSVALPVCLIYDGSIQNNAQTMNNENAQLKRTYYYVASAAGQQKQGLDAEGEAVKAMNDQLGDIQKSNSEIRASGGVYNTSNYLGAQSSPSGDYTIFDAVFGGTLGSVANAIANTTCPTATNVVFGAALGTINIVGCLVPVVGQAGCIGEEAVQKGAQTVMGRLAGKFLTWVANEEKGQTATAIGGLIQDGAKSAGKTAVGVVAGTLLARSIVYSHANMNHNGLQQNTDLANDVDNGGGLVASDYMRQIFYGRPLTDAETSSVQKQDRYYLVEKNRSSSLYDRYANTTNPGSLISRMAISMGGFSDGFSSFTKTLSTLFSPLRSFGKLIGSVIVKPTFAADEDKNVSKDQNYGNVTWGYSDDEFNLIKTDPSYGILENQKILDDSGQEDAINSKYASCMTKQMGDLLADPGNGIKRTDSGDVSRDSGLCSPNNLSYDSPDSLAADSSPDTSKPRDLIFRWRVAHGYDNSLDTLINQQDVTQ